MAVSESEPGYRFALVSSCVLFMICSAGMLVFNKLVLRRIGLPITVSGLDERAPNLLPLCQ